MKLDQKIQVQHHEQRRGNRIEAQNGSPTLRSGRVTGLARNDCSQVVERKMIAR
jgi:hypothetical protein